MVSDLLDWQQGQPGTRVFLLEGKRMRRAQGFYDEVARELGFPDYFGRNLDALDECLTDPDVLEGKALVVLVRNADEVLSEEDAQKLDGALDTLKDAGAKWAVAVNNGQAWDRGAAPFHVILQMETENHSTLSALPSL